MNFNAKVLDICRRKRSFVCVGLDVDLEKIPAALQREPDALFIFSKAIIEATVPFAAAYKINTAFFEAYGKKGWDALERISALLPDDVIRIADAKRADIGNTSRRYARAFFDEMPFDALTVNPYLGSDAVAPFLERPDKGAFILCVTSNRGAVDFQHCSDGREKLYERVARYVMEWNTNRNCGLVTGATHPDELGRIRKIAPGIPLLIPGIGAQGGDLEKAVNRAIQTNDDTALINSSRGIIYASSDSSFAECAAKQAEMLRNTINQIVKKRKER